MKLSKLNRTLGLSLCLFLQASCKQQIKLTGVVIDETDRRPVSNAQVRTLMNINGKRLNFATAITNVEGKFEINYDSEPFKAVKLPIEVSKANYMTNIYDVSQTSVDTIILKRLVQQYLNHKLQ